MEFRLVRNRKLVAKVHKVPKHYRRFGIMAAQPIYVKGTFGDYFTQIITAENCRIQLNIFHILADILLHPYTARSIISLHFMLKGNIKCFLGGFGEAWLIEKCANLFYVPGKMYHKAWFKPGIYKSFHIDFSPRTLIHPASKYRELRDVLNRFSGYSTEGVWQHTSFITPEVQKIIKDILNFFPTEEPDLSFFAEIKSKELLLKYVQNTPSNLNPIPSTEKEFIDHITNFMETHLDYPLTIKLLARTFSTNETMLKRRFKQYTGQTIFVFLTKIRMEHAAELLQDHRLPIGDIPSRVGYKDFSSFDRAFRYYFGHTPSFYRKK